MNLLYAAKTLAAGALILAMFSACSECPTPPEPQPEQVAKPVISPAEGIYTTPQTVEISCSTIGATIVYTLDGSDPSSSSPVYTAALGIFETATVKAQAFRQGNGDSAVASAIFTINLQEPVATPEFYPPAGAYYSAVNVTISSATGDAMILYTTDGSEPSAGSPVYAGPVPLTGTAIIKARGFKPGWNPSAIARGLFTIGSAPERMVFVPGGSFNNGVSEVAISSFYLDKTEITQASYQSVMGVNPAYFPGVNDGPVERVSWFDAIEYCNRRSAMEALTPCYSYDGYGTDPATWPQGWNTEAGNHSYVTCDFGANGFRLPTEMEWMFAARGGIFTQNHYYSGSDDLNAVAWYVFNAANVTHPTGTKQPNELGIFDMSGNVWEWVWDIHGDYPMGGQTNPQGPSSGSYRVWRGGGFNSVDSSCSVSHRFYSPANYPLYNLGFRICRSSL